MLFPKFSYPYKLTLFRYYNRKPNFYFFVHDIYIPFTFYVLFAQDFYISILLHIIFQRVYEIGYAHNDKMEISKEKNRNNASYLLTQPYLVDNLFYCILYILMCLLINTTIILMAALTLILFFLHNKRWMNKKLSFCSLMIARYSMILVTCEAGVGDTDAIMVLLLYTAPFGINRIFNYFRYNFVMSVQVVTALICLMAIVYAENTEYLLGILPLIIYVLVSNMRKLRDEN